MINDLKKCIIIAVMLSMVVGLFAGCTNKQSGNSASSGETEPVELKFMAFGDNVRGLDDVLKEFERRTKDTLNTKLNIEISAINDHKQKLKLKIAGGEEIDGVFDAQWVSLTTMVSQGAYVPLDEYFMNDKYPGLKKAFSQDYINSNKFKGHVYGIPATTSYGKVDNIISIRKDLREKYGMPKIQSIEELETFLQNVKDKESGMIPLAVSGLRGFYKLFSDTTDKAKKNIFPVVVIPSSGLDFEVAISPDNKKVLGAVVVAGNINFGGMYGGDTDEYYRNFPEPFNKPDTYKMEMHTKWNKYLETDAAVQNDPKSLFLTGKAAALEGNVSEKQLKASLPNAEMELFLGDDYQRTLQPGTTPSDFQAWNFLCIPTTSKKVERTMKFVDWVFSDQSNYDLLVSGIEGKHWVKNEKGEIAPAPGITTENSYNGPFWQFFGVPEMTRMSADLDPDTKVVVQYMTDTKTFWKIPTAGFMFDQEPVKNELAKIAPVFKEIYSPLIVGMYPDPVSKVRAANQKAKELGLEKVRQEVINQMQKFLDKMYGGK